MPLLARFYLLLFDMKIIKLIEMVANTKAFITVCAITNISNAFDY